MSLWGELRRRDVFKVAVAYLVAAWLIVQIVSVLTDPLNLPDELDTAVVVLLAIGFPFVLLVAWIYEVTPEGIKVTSDADARSRPIRVSGQRLSYVIIGLLVMAVGLMAFDAFVLTPAPRDSNQVTRTAVLPCFDLSPDPTDSFFAEGMHAELIDRLGSLSGLDVISQTSTLRYADGRAGIPQVAQELSVATLIECSARYSGSQVRLMVQLIDAESDTDLWSDTFRADMSDLSSLFDIQAEIAMQVANALRIEFLDEEIEQIQRLPTQSRDAYELYLAARAENAGVGGGPRAIQLLDQALEIDEEFAEAWSAKAGTLSVIYAVTANEAERAAVLSEAMDAADRAVTFAPDQAHGHSARSALKAIQNDWLGAARDERAAQERGAPRVNALILLSAGYVESGREVWEQVLNDDPLNANAHFFLMLSQEVIGDSAAADDIYRRGQQLFPPGTWLGGAGSTFVRLGRGEVGPEYDPIIPITGMGEMDEGVNDPVGGLSELRRLVADAENQSPVLFVNYAVLAAYFEDPEFALELLERSVSETGSGLLMYMAWLPVFDEVRQLPGFKILLQDIGLVDYWQTSGWPDTCSPLANEDFVCS